MAFKYTALVKTPKLAVVGVPTAAGARGSGVARGPLALRDHGLLQALAADGTRVVNLSDLSLFPYRVDEEHPKARNAEVVACAVRTAADEMTRALAEGFTVVLGGDCTLVVGTLAGAQAHLGTPVGLIYLDAHADLHSPETTISGYLQGMALALAVGHGPASVAGAGGATPAVHARHVALLGTREWEAGEAERGRTLGLRLDDEEMRRDGMIAAAGRALSAVPEIPLVVHLDVDVIRPEEMPAVEVVTPGGLTLVEVAELLRALLASRRVVALEVVQYDADRDPQGVCAQRIVDLVASALARHPAP
jgi:arginase